MTSKTGRKSWGKITSIPSFIYSGKSPAVSETHETNGGEDGNTSESPQLRPEPQAGRQCLSGVGSVIYRTGILVTFDRQNFRLLDPANAPFRSGKSGLLERYKTLSGGNRSGEPVTGRQ